MKYFEVIACAGIGMCLVLLVFILLFLVYTYESSVMKDANDYILQIIDVCMAELKYQKTGVNGVLTDRQKAFLLNLIY
jgi:hypothetical protein